MTSQWAQVVKKTSFSGLKFVTTSPTSLRRLYYVFLWRLSDVYLWRLLNVIFSVLLYLSIHTIPHMNPLFSGFNMIQELSFCCNLASVDHVWFKDCPFTSNVCNTVYTDFIILNMENRPYMNVRFWIFTFMTIFVDYKSLKQIPIVATWYFMTHELLWADFFCEYRWQHLSKVWVHHVHKAPLALYIVNI